MVTRIYHYFIKHGPCNFACVHSLHAQEPNCMVVQRHFMNRIGTFEHHTCYASMSHGSKSALSVSQNTFLTHSNDLLSIICDTWLSVHLICQHWQNDDHVGWVCYASQYNIFLKLRHMIRTSLFITITSHIALFEVLYTELFSAEHTGLPQSFACKVMMMVQITTVWNILSWHFAL